MATLNISMPDPMRDWVQAQIKGGRYASSSDYVRDLIRQDQMKADKLRQLQTALEQGLASGTSEHSMEKILDIARMQADGHRNNE